jgi:CTP:phosphocholine cytidylyltransferase involved in choline phosphorylation for cell surface LPS epitopes
MNKRECDIMNNLAKEPYINQRILAQTSGYSLGAVNSALKSLNKMGYLDEEMNLTKSARDLMKQSAPKNAIILAAGFGMRMAPLHTVTSKGLLEIGGEALVERLIGQLHEAGIQDIYIIVGFMKEQYEYLIDEYGVTLIVNPDYAIKNNLHSLALAGEYLDNTYIVPCDTWCEENPFQGLELYSWYMVTQEHDSKSSVRVNRKMELVSTLSGIGGNQMIGISYLAKREADIVRNRMVALCQNARYDGAFWEETLYEKKRMIIKAKVLEAMKAVEINTYEQLCEIDEDSNHLSKVALAIIEQALGVKSDEIDNVTTLKKGMTNRSFLIECKNEKYIMRISGEGTEKFINRVQEKEVYEIIAGKGLCDDVVYINAQNGYKITKYINEVRVCDPEDKSDVWKCMKRLREFHQMKLSVAHEFCIFEQISMYEALWGEMRSVYRDYDRTKEQVLQLEKYIDMHVEEKVLTHIDAVPDNFLFVPSETGEEAIQLIDWEYAGMQDPHVDIAMFAIYALYNKEQVDNLIEAYFTKGCADEIRIKIYCYIAACGLLWSNWCENKRNLGVDFGEYALRQYRYAKEYYKIVKNELQSKGEWLGE